MPSRDLQAGIKTAPLLIILLLVGISNALLRPMIAAFEAQSTGSWLAEGFGINAVIWLGLILGLIRVIQNAGNAPSTPLAITTICLLLWLTPSTALAWVGLATLCLSAVLFSQRSLGANLRAGLLILTAVALREPLCQLLLKLTISPLLTLDAWLVTSVAEWINPGYRRIDNLIVNPDGFQLLILTGCTSYANLSLILLCWISLTLYFSSTWKPAFWVHGLLLAAMSLVINILRLVVMSLDQNLYHLFHEGLGASLYGFMITALPLLFSYWSIHYERHHSDQTGLV